MKWQKHAGLITGIIVLVLVNYAIYKKELHLATGQIAYLQLAPVDPRSLMQGDYMALRFSMASEINQKLSRDTNRSWRREAVDQDGKAVVNLDDNLLATFIRLYTGEELAPGEMLMRFRVRNGELKFATNAFFFQEGTAKIYEQARYGQFRVDEHGDLLLVNMADKDFKVLGFDRSAESTL